MLRQAVATVLLLVTVPQLTGCIPIHSTKRITPEKVPSPTPTDRLAQAELITGVTLNDGGQITFAKDPRPYVESDTLRGMGTDGDFHRIALADVQRVWVRRLDPGLTLLASLGALAAVAGLGLAVIVATKESCPFVYSWDGTRYVFDAEPYGGATTRGLERDDWATLEHLRPVQGEYRLLVTNEVNETQYTNALELLVVDHPAGVSVVPDARGGLHTLRNVLPPASASDREGTDLRPWLTHTDEAIWEPQPPTDTAGDLREEVTLTFPRPAGASHARLSANVATGLWGSHMIRAMLELWGRDVGEWYQALDTRQSARDSLLAWNLREEIFALKVYVQEPTGWQVRGVLEGGGPFIAEDRVLPLDLSRVIGDSVRIRLRPPRGFWAFNSFGLDYGADEAVHVDTLAPLTARDTAGSVRPALLEPDTDYYVMPDKGDHAWLAFRAPPPRPGLERTVLLHSRGYYRLHLDATGPADTATLRRLSAEPGATARFAARRFAERRLAGGSAR